MFEHWTKLLDAVMDDGTAGGNITDPAIVDAVVAKTEDKIDDKKEEDVSKLDLTEPEHLTKFKASYSTYKTGFEDRGTEIESLKKENDDLRANRDRGVYLDTNVPLEEFNPDETLAKMIEDEPDYYEKLAASFMSAHFWPSVGDSFKEIEQKKLDPNNEADVEVYQQLETAWDVLSKKVAGVDGVTLYAIMDTLSKSPDLRDEVVARMNGQSTYRPDAPFNAPQQTNNKSFNLPNGQPAAVETIQQVATRLNLDPSEEVHLNHINAIRQDQYNKLMSQQNNHQPQPNQANQAYEDRLKQMQAKIDELTTNRQKEHQISDEDLTKQATSRLDGLVNTSMKNEVDTVCGKAIPKGKEHLLEDIMTIAKTNLDKDTTYQEMRRRSIAWFKQAMNTSNTNKRDEWDKRGADGVAAMVPIRMKYIKAAAERQLGPIKTSADNTASKAKDIKRGRELDSTGRTVAPHRDTQPAKPGDIQSAKEAIRNRAKSLFR